MNNDLLKILKSEIELLQDGYKNLEYSYSTCMKIGIKSNYSLQELESYEALWQDFQG